MKRISNNSIKKRLKSIDSQNYKLKNLIDNNNEKNNLNNMDILIRHDKKKIAEKTFINNDISILLKLKYLNMVNHSRKSSLSSNMSKKRRNSKKKINEK